MCKAAKCTSLRPSAGRTITKIKDIRTGSGVKWHQTFDPSPGNHAHTFKRGYAVSKTLTVLCVMCEYLISA